MGADPGSRDICSPNRVYFGISRFRDAAYKLMDQVRMGASVAPALQKGEVGIGLVVNSPLSKPPDRRRQQIAAIRRS